MSTNTRYDVQVRAESDEGYSAWSESWEGTTSDDYDKDDDGLIEVSTLEQLNAIRYDLDGNGTVDDATNASAYALAFPSATSGMGCPQSGCKGYELTTALDFDNSSWNTGSGWEPLGTSSNKFTAIFDGGGNILSNLLINRSGSAGLFGESSGSIKNVGLVNVDVNGTGKVGGLLGKNDGKVSNCFVTGQVSSSDRAGGLVGSNSDTIRTSYSKVDVTNTLNGGGLVGHNEGVLLACYATGQVSTSRNAGGLVGWNSSSASIKYCYATGSVSSSGTGANGRRVGGFFGGLETPSSSSEYGLSYWNTEMTGQSSRAGGRFSTHSNSNKIRDYIKGKTTSQLRSPTGYSGIYGTWDDEDTTGDEMADAPWDFGTASQYPILKVDFNGDGNATFQEFGTQRVFSSEPTISSVTLSGQQLTVVWDPPSDQGSSAISAYDVRYISESADQSVNANWTEVTDAWTSGNLEYTITGLSNSLGGYAVQVRAAMGLSRWSGAKFTHAMTWVNFAQAKQNNEEPILPDFSYAGYHYFAKPVPDVTHTEFDVTAYGAFPNDNKSDHRAIQDAIDAAVANGSGVVKFPAGEFLINTDQDYPGQIFVRGSNIVLRGAGSRDGGTIIRQVNFLRSPSSAKDANPYCLVFDGSSNGASEEITRVTEDAERETFWITVADAGQVQKVL